MVLCTIGKQIYWGPSSDAECVSQLVCSSHSYKLGTKILRESMCGAYTSQLSGGSGRISNSRLVWAALPDPVFGVLILRLESRKQVNDRLL